MWVMDPMGPETKNDYAGKGQQRITALVRVVSGQQRESPLSEAAAKQQVHEDIAYREDLECAVVICGSCRIVEVV
jgi:hypothetical protein